MTATLTNIFLLNLIPQDTLTYDWHPKDLILSGDSTFNPLISVNENTSFFVHITNQHGCEIWDTLFVEVSDIAPLLEAFADPESILLGDSTQLSSTVYNDYTYTWSPPETLNDPAIPNPVAKPAETTVYTVTINKDDGCPASAQVRVTVTVPECIEPYVYLPNIFTPNNDGKNDILQVLGVSIDEVHLMIYNRWGNKVFESFRQDHGWDGTYKGKELTSDVYGYYLRVRCLNGEEMVRKGKCDVGEVSGLRVTGYQLNEQRGTNNEKALRQGVNSDQL